MKNEKLTILIIFSLLCLAWGSTWGVIRLGLESLTPFISVGLRFTLASIFILIIMKFRNVQIQTDKVSLWLYFIMCFGSFVIPFGLVYWAEQFVPSGLSSVLFAVYPFFVVVFSYLAIPSEVIGFYRIFGIVFAFAGILTIFYDGLNLDVASYMWGMSAIVLSGIMQAGNAVTLKKYGYYLHPLSMNFIPMIVAGISLVIIGLLVEDTSKLVFDPKAYFTIIYLAAIGTVLTFTSYYWLLKRVSVILLSLIAFITPIIALIIGWIFFEEKLSDRVLFGSILVLLGLLIANFSSFKKLLGYKFVSSGSESI
ncbi:MAG: multidrug DMT transporter permease [Ignavibacteria bacterium RIFOXYB2_FULL_35_12]|nr:MAG: multidrug DMT transporter permease [Ignavibacteria bacterium GWA2_36_19]OGU56210.1 MAG: multidrug DMT transporter permease [Ignavibacteria bacterium GWF2_35_20]OGU80355.1 MAG: multidrug DMT transporter permease [Ignavibacteria bacterium RIFOXYA2_FULL_35_9]OGU86722.1 MAG: multidrug DMT transporter permease [Ignavibacteria bacterium RIFOXYC12_FULL_35_11]OGU89417.1 MAG: multidrug DMT transporter permease [Ignavibacteria bacterium RIFOXYA12_FULL_35_25]OGU94109.1 MAG: multidrug DMT transpor